MKKTLCIVIPIVVVLLVLVGGLFYYIGNKNASEQAISGKDKEFLSVLSKGLEERSAFVKEQEKVSANGGTPKFTGADYSRELVNKESKIFEFENAEFDSPRLSQLVKEYIDALKKQKEAVDYYSTDYIKYNDIWSKGYAERSTVIAALCDEFGLKLGKDLAECKSRFCRKRQNKANRRYDYKHSVYKRKDGIFYKYIFCHSRKYNPIYIQFYVAYNKLV